MSVSRQRKLSWIPDQRGFTLIEVLVTILIIGIVTGIASSSWQSVTKGRVLTSATNQVVADLRNSHSIASNRLVAQEVRFTVGSNYQTRPEGGTYKTVSLPSEGAATEVSTPVTLLFKPDGSVTANGVAGANATIRVQLANDNTKFSDIQVNASTSRVKDVP